MVDSSQLSVNLQSTLLADPLKDRPMKDKDCPILSQKPISDEKFWVKEGVPDWKLLKDFLTREGPVTKP